MSLFITQCPHCHTSFKTSVSQLQSADGMVRCGGCLRVFAADDNLLPSVDIRTVNLPAHDEDDTVDNEDNVNEDQLPLSDLTTTDDKDDDEIEDPQSIFTLDMADSLPNRVSPIISESDTSWQLIDEDATEHGQDTEPTLPSSTNDDPEAETSLESTDHRAATTSSDERNEAFTAHDELHAEKPDEDALARARINATEFSSEILNDQFHPHDLNDLNVDNLENLNFDENALELNWQETPKKTLGIALMSFVLLMCLALQTLWVNRNALAQNPQWRPTIETLCTPLNCGLQPLADIGLIRSDQLAIQSHPEFSNALRVQAQFRNDAAFAQALPGLLLQFTNNSNEVVAQRRFTPEEYLDDELKELAAMPAKSQLQVSLDLLDPGPQALNYEISFYAIPAS